MIVPKYGTVSGLRQAPGEAVSVMGALGPFPDACCRLSDDEIRFAIRRVSAGLELCLEEVECWRGYARADFVYLSNGAVSVIEIKSDRDSLRRFDEQVRVYGSIAERVTLVVGWTLAARVLRAAPNWWDVVLAERDSSSGVRLVPLRDGAPNPDSNLEGLVAMLPLQEVRRLATESGAATGRLRGIGLRRAVAAHAVEQNVRDALTRWLAELASRRTVITA